jgi:hypothetical protein
MAHLTYKILVAALVSAAVALTGNREWRERLYAGTYLFCCCAAATLAGSWAMYWIHG